MSQGIFWAHRKLHRDLMKLTRGSDGTGEDLIAAGAKRRGGSRLLSWRRVLRASEWATDAWKRTIRSSRSLPGKALAKRGTGGVESGSPAMRKTTGKMGNWIDWALRGIGVVDELVEEERRAPVLFIGGMRRFHGLSAREGKKGRWSSRAIGNCRGLG